MMIGSSMGYMDCALCARAYQAREHVTWESDQTLRRPWASPPPTARLGSGAGRPRPAVPPTHRAGPTGTLRPRQLRRLEAPAPTPALPASAARVASPPPCAAAVARVGPAAAACPSRRPRRPSRRPAGWHAAPRPGEGSLGGGSPTAAAAPAREAPAMRSIEAPAPAYCRPGELERDPVVDASRRAGAATLGRENALRRRGTVPTSPGHDEQTRRSGEPGERRVRLEQDRSLEVGRDELEAPTYLSTPARRHPTSIREPVQLQVARAASTAAGSTSVASTHAAPDRSATMPRIPFRCDVEHAASGWARQKRSTLAATSRVVA